MPVSVSGNPIQIQRRYSFQNNAKQSTEKERLFSGKFVWPLTLAFLFAWFASSQLSFQFIESKYREKGSDYLQRIHAEIDILKDQAMQAMMTESQALNNTAPKQQSLMSPLINRFIEVAVGCSK